jgi:hypothetical protein
VRPEELFSPNVKNHVQVLGASAALDVLPSRVRIQVEAAPIGGLEVCDPDAPPAVQDLASKLQLNTTPVPFRESVVVQAPMDPNIDPLGFLPLVEIEM